MLLNGRLHEIHTELKNQNQNKSDLDKKQKQKKFAKQLSRNGMNKNTPPISAKRKRREKKKW